MKTRENAMKKVFQNRNFSLLLAGQGTSLLGDQFEMIAAPWLVLKLTNDPAALGAVMALSSIPRAVFMLVGGAVTDRLSSRTIMLVSDAIRLVLTVLMTALILTGSLQVWMLYGFALLFGTVGGFFSPAASSILPHILETEQLQAGNSLVQGTAQLTNFAGPAIAGGMIALLSNSQAGAAPAGMLGIAAAFGIDALSFIVSIVTLLGMSPVKVERATAGENVLAAIREGIHYAFSDQALRFMFILIAGANLVFVGPLLVGMPVLAQQRLAEGAAAFGLIMSAYGGGNLAGILLAGTLPKPRAGWLNFFIVGLLAEFGIALAGFAFIHTTWIAFAVLLTLGVGNGYFAITMFTMLQQRTPTNMIGRMMSLVLFSNVGLMPVSQALAGVLLKSSLEGLFLGAGVLMLALAGWAALAPDARLLGNIILANTTPEG